MERKLENYKKDKMVTLRLSPLDIYVINYIYRNSWIADMLIFYKCTDLINTVVYNLCDDIEKADDKRTFFHHLNLKRKNLSRKKSFMGITQIKIMGTELSYGKPYNVYMSSEILSTIQNYMIEHTEVQRPHSSWITQLALVNTFAILAEKKGEFKFDLEDDLVGEHLKDFEKIDLIDKFVCLFKDDVMNADKIKRIKEILDES